MRKQNDWKNRALLAERKWAETAADYESACKREDKARAEIEAIALCYNIEMAAHEKTMAALRQAFEAMRANLVYAYKKDEQVLFAACLVALKILEPEKNEEE